MSASGTACFQVDGDGLTNIVRQLNLEGKHDKALAILYHIDGLPVDEAHRIINGSRRLTGVGDGMRLDDDDQEAEVAKQLSELADCLKRREEQAHLDVLNAKRMQWASRMPSEILQRITPNHSEPPTRPPPEHDKALASKNGWLSPDGKLYGCQYHEHDQLADSLGLQYSLAGIRGWVKLQTQTTISTWSEPNSEATQAQIDVMFDWTQKHGGHMPHWLDEDD